MFNKGLCYNIILNFPLESKVGDAARAKLNEKAEKKAAGISTLREEVEEIKKKLEDPKRIKLTKDEFLNLTINDKNNPPLSGGSHLIAS